MPEVALNKGALLEVRDLCVDLPDRSVLSAIDFTIAAASIVGLCGDSGSGKTTLSLALLKLLASPPYRVRGQVLLEGRDLLNLRERDLQTIRGGRIGFVFQDPLLALNPVLKIRTQLTEILQAHGRREDLSTLLALVGISESARILDAYPHQISGGERQRITIAQALACRPALIIADEPFTALDAPRVVELAGVFRRLRDETGTSLLIISHAPGVLALLADEVMRMSAGRIVERGAAREVLRRG